MNELDDLDIEKISELIKYIPILKEPGFNPIKDENEPLIGLDVNYSDKAEEFMKAVTSEYWLNWDYNKEKASHFVQNKEEIKSASLQDIKDIFSFLNRGERLCSGIFLNAFESGVILNCLLRLREITREDS